jgi:hypothetical protein
VLVGDTAAVPLVALVPVQPPDAVQDVALVEDHVKVELPPAVMLVGLADKDAVGVGLVDTAVTVTVTEAGVDVELVPAQASV